MNYKSPINAAEAQSLVVPIFSSKSALDASTVAANAGGLAFAGGKLYRRNGSAWHEVLVVPFEANVDAGGFQIQNMAAGTAANHAVTKAQLDASASKWTAIGADVYRAAGKVGVGISSPTSSLHVSGAGGAAPTVALEDANNTWFGAAALIRNKATDSFRATGVYMHSDVAQETFFVGGTSEVGALIFGRVASASPAYSASSPAANPLMKLTSSRISKTTAGLTNHIELVTTDGGSSASPAKLGIFANGGNYAASGLIEFHTFSANSVRSDFVLSLASNVTSGIVTERLRVNGATGNVGVGTADPTATLDVAGAARVRALTSGVVTSDASGNLSSVAASALGVPTIYTTNGSLTGSRAVTIPSSAILTFDTSASNAEFRVAHAGGLLTRLLADGRNRRAQFVTDPAYAQGDEFYSSARQRPCWAVGAAGADVRNTAAIEDYIGDTQEIVTTSNVTVGGTKLNYRFHAASGSQTGHTLGATMLEGRWYALRFTSNGTNTVTLNAESGYVFNEAGNSTFTTTTIVCGGSGTGIAAPHQIILARRIGTVIILK